jgi:cytidine deaminase
MFRIFRSDPAGMRPLTEAEREKLLKAAGHARNRAYAPYSGFPVGAAILTGDGAVFAGCNVENSSYGLTICAERVALFKAVSEGAVNPEAVALVTDTPEPVMPCGACRQVLAEFNRDMTIVAGTVQGKSVSRRLSDLLPDAFELKNPGVF